VSDHQLLLFATGDAPRSQRARANLANALERVGLQGLEPEEVDLLQQSELAFQYGVFATPALALVTPKGRQQLLYGDLADEDRLFGFLAALNDVSG